MKAAPARLLLAFVGAPALVVLLLALVELGYAVAGADPRRHYFLPVVDEAGQALLVESRDPPISNACFRATRFTRRVDGMLMQYHLSLVDHAVPVERGIALWQMAADVMVRCARERRGRNPG